ncbi:MAG: hypothetical protein IKG85_05110 [Clostridia bacterium]|nr:hypothetical protein [Clostridia bacterium]
MDRKRLVDAAILLIAALVYLALVSPVSVVKLAAASAGPVYLSGEEGAIGLIIKLPWEAKAASSILDTLESAGVPACFAVTAETARAAPKLVYDIAARGHTTALLYDGEPVGGALERLSAVTGERPAFLIAGRDLPVNEEREAGRLGLTIIVPTVELPAGASWNGIGRTSLNGGTVAAEPTEAFAAQLPFFLEKIKNMGLDIVSIHKMLYN